MFDPKDILHHAFAIKKAYESVLEPVMNKYSLTRAEIDVIAFLLCNPEFDTSRDIVEYRMIAKSHVSKAVDNLIERGYLTRSQDASDKRVLHLSLTEKAGDAARDIKSCHCELASTLSDGITEEESAVFLSAATKLAANAQKML